MHKKNKNGLSPMDYALSYLTSKDRTYWEMQNYLDTKNFGEADIESTLNRLSELGMIDDKKYAIRFVQTRLASKPLSSEHIKRQLLDHHISMDLIQEALEQISDDSDLVNACEIAKKFYRQFANLEAEKRRSRILSRLQSRGFPIDICYKAYQAACDSCSEEADN